MQITLAEGSSGEGPDYEACMLELRADLSQACKQLEEERALNRQKEAAVVERDGLIRDYGGQVGAFLCSRKLCSSHQSSNSPSWICHCHVICA